MIMRNDIVVFLACTISILQLAVSSTSTTCNRSCGNSSKPVPFPFGFSSACQIQLNCSTMGHILVGEFPVRSIDSDSILVELQARCDRSIDTLHQLFNHNYAPTTRNGILLRNCSLPMSPCMTPTAMGENIRENMCERERGGGKRGKEEKQRQPWHNHIGSRRREEEKGGN
ncbi:hypothetical protein L1049_004705 [Liquidambar formosana]|uniref:Wall-associated receptor kinase galacturonan-binding domain-containing protein n=1 Tax=Liquidambar formosana TaxID=63359 RepID=A0AAP0WVY1_LIQFO